MTYVTGGLHMTSESDFLAVKGTVQKKATSAVRRLRNQKESRGDVYRR